MEQVPTDQEREFVKEVADFGVMAGWDRSIQKHAQDSGLSEEQIILMLNRVADYNDKADPKGRIDALEDWKRHKTNPNVDNPARGQGKTVT